MRREVAAASSVASVGGGTPATRVSMTPSTTAEGGAPMSSRGAPARVAAATSSSASGWPWAKRFARAASGSSSPRARSIASASASRSGPSRSSRTSSAHPGPAVQAAPGGSRPAMTVSSESGIAGRKTCRSQASSR